MHYIIGTQITLGTRSMPTVSRGMTSQQLAEISRLKRSNTQNNKIRDLFEVNTTYTLIRIFAKEDKVVYKFSDTTGTIVEAEFDTVKQGESFISEVRGEEVPVYTLNHIIKSD